jgi:hypothetical protein
VEFFSQLFASAIGGAIAGYLVLVGVNLQFRRQSEAALRALKAEVAANKEAAIEMNRNRTPSGDFKAGHPHPGWLKHSIWDSQLTSFVQLLDAEALIVVRRAYSLLDSVPAMFNERRGPGDPRFSVGGWIDGELVKIETAFCRADQTLENRQERLAQEADGVWLNRVQKFAADLRLWIAPKSNQKI